MQFKELWNSHYNFESRSIWSISKCLWPRQFWPMVSWNWMNLFLFKSTSILEFHCFISSPNTSFHRPFWILSAALSFINLVFIEIARPSSLLLLLYLFESIWVVFGQIAISFLHKLLEIGSARTNLLLNIMLV